ELVDANGAPVPIVEGNTGELGCTHLRRECQSLIGYRPRALLTLTPSAASESGRTRWPLRVAGRTDDLFSVSGISVVRGSVQHAIRGHASVVTGEFRIQLAGQGPWDFIELKVEAAKDLPDSQWPEAGRSLEQAIRKDTGASAR